MSRLFPNGCPDMAPKGRRRREREPRAADVQISLTIPQLHAVCEALGGLLAGDLDGCPLPSRTYHTAHSRCARALAKAEDQ